MNLPLLLFCAGIFAFVVGAVLFGVALRGPALVGRWQVFSWGWRSWSFFWGLDWPRPSLVIFRAWRLGPIEARRFASAPSPVRAQRGAL